MFQFKIITSAAVLFSALNAPANAGSKLAGEVRKPDQGCGIVNQAYKNTRHANTYSEVVNVVQKDKLQLLQERRVTTSGAFERVAPNLKWTKLDKAPPADTEYLRFSYCTYVDAKGGPHLRAYWNRPPQYANSEVWLTRDFQNLRKVRREFPFYDEEFPSKTLLTTFDYDIRRVKPPAPEEVLP
ncbi:hypothetical protein [Rhizobium sp. BK176]|uniref:hypothetical protein n=1 Tax=Rhizobium sp. BK176 TaxID=2587071 RepID=UPI002166F059|nr:hypothetical protein [Rhizobium sp. BK176]MCS4091837.1 hypothetical protein [Rhizobium sp. BK176]